MTSFEPAPDLPWRRLCFRIIHNEEALGRPTNAPDDAKYFGVHVPPAFQNAAGSRYYLPYEQVTTLMYLKISISDFLTLFAARTRGPFYSRAPSLPLVSAFVVATVVATVLSVAVNIYDNTYPMHHISAGAACFVWGWNIAFFVVQDLARTYRWF